VTGTNLYVNKCKQSQSHLNHLVYMKSILWRVAKYLSCIEEARCLKVNAWPVTDIRHRMGLSPCVKNIVFVDFSM